MFRQRPYFHFYHSRFDKYKNVDHFSLSVDLLQFGKNKILSDIFFIPIGVGLSDCFDCIPFWSTNRVLTCAVVLTVQNFSCLPTFSQTSFESIGFPGTHQEKIILHSYLPVSLSLLFIWSAWLNSLLLGAWMQSHISRKEVPIFFLSCLALGSTQDEFSKMVYWMACPEQTSGMPLYRWFPCRDLLWKYTKCGVWSVRETVLIVSFFFFVRLAGVAVNLFRTGNSASYILMVMDCFKDFTSFSVFATADLQWLQMLSLQGQLILLCLLIICKQEYNCN